MNTLTLTSLDFSKGIEIVHQPTYSYVGVPSISSFSISVTADGVNYATTDIGLYASNSKSFPHHEDMVNLWSDLKPMWRFVDVDKTTRFSETAEIEFHTELKHDGETVGAIGSVEFYYIDDLPTDVSAPVSLIATLDTTLMYDISLLSDNIEEYSFYNNHLSKIMEYHVLPLEPSFLYVGESGHRSISYQQWVGATIPAYVTVRGSPPSPDALYGINDIRSYPILFNYPSSSEFVYHGIINIESDSPVVEMASFEKRSGVSTGGWVKLETVPLNATTATIINASMDITYDKSEIDTAVFSVIGGTIPSATEIISKTIQGSSENFAILLPKNNYEIRRFNDSWDMAEQIKSYVLPEFQKEFTSLWDDFIGVIVGSDTSQYETLGRQMYEKISNFVKNNSCIEHSNIDEFDSSLASIGIHLDGYHLTYPAQIKNWMDILSIPYQKLKGEQVRCNRNFVSQKIQDTEECEVCGNIHKSNLGASLDQTTYQMVVGTPIVIQDTYKINNQFDIFYPPVSGSVSILEEYGFRSSFSAEYKIYEYIDYGFDNENEQAEGHINWNDENNEIDISTISNADWIKDKGYLEKIFNTILSRGLGIIPSSKLYGNAHIIEE